MYKKNQQDKHLNNINTEDLRTFSLKLITEAQNGTSCIYLKWERACYTLKKKTGEETIFIMK